MLRVMVVFGGRSREHEVSLASARAILSTLEKSGNYDVYPVGITKEGRWLSSGDPLRELASGKADGGSGLPAPVSEKLPVNLGRADVVFPVLHGPYGEDGTIQGMLELAGIPYVGSGVLASAASMDKVTMKKVFAYHGLPQVEWVSLTRKEWEENHRQKVREVESSLGYPCFVKPSNLGSSVGISKVYTPEELEYAISFAADLDRRIIVESAADAHEIEVAVLGNEAPKISVPGEVLIGSHEFYDYEAKYTEGESEIQAPADIPAAAAVEINEIARTAFKAVDAAGMARIDFFLERGTGRVLLNEINTIPGFTPTSVYARLWDTSGLPYGELLDELVRLAIERHEAKS
ncbi:MAG: D-alanine--D-alanine ligase family protein [Rubrobacteraceae bacterium]